MGATLHRSARIAIRATKTQRRRLYGLLVRRGYAPGVARDACRAALAAALGSIESFE